MIVLIVILCILASPVILGVASAGIGVAAGLIAAWLGPIVGFRGNGGSTDTDSRSHWWLQGSSVCLRIPSWEWG